MNILDEPSTSHVIGHLIDGIFDGIIRSKHGSFHIEHAHKFFPEARGFHSIMYHEEDVRKGPPSPCAANGKLPDLLNAKASHAIPLDDNFVLYGRDKHSRLRRSTIFNNRFCPIRVAADHLYFQNVGAENVAVTMSSIATVMASVQEIYRSVDFDEDGFPDQIQPVIASLEILRFNSTGYRYSEQDIPIINFLDLWSQEEQPRNFCLSLLLTHRDFANGTLGLAWLAQPTGGIRGGICEGRVKLEVGTRYLNTAVVTSLNYGQPLPRSLLIVAIAHQLGHSFGSPVCTSNYIIMWLEQCYGHVHLSPT